MGDVVSDGTSFSCPLCTGKLKIKVPSSSAEGDAKKLANTGNYLFPPPGAQCLLIPNAPAPCAPPSVSTVDPGQSPIQIDGKKALGADCKLQCAKSGLLTVASPGQSSAQHDGASEGGGVDIWDVIDIATWLIPGVQEVKAATLLGRIALRARKIYQALRGAKKIAPNSAPPAPAPKQPTKPPATQPPPPAPQKGPAGSQSPPKQRNKPPPPDPKAEGRPHTIIEKSGKDGQYTTHNGDGTYKQYRGSGKDHGPIPRPNVKENTLNHSPKGPIPGKPSVRPPRPDEIPH